MAEAANPLDEFDAQAPARGAAAGNPLDEFDRASPQPLDAAIGSDVDRSEAAGKSRQLFGGAGKAIVDVATFPYRALQSGSKEATERLEQSGYRSPVKLPPMMPLEDMDWYKPIARLPEPQTTGEKFYRATGEAVGSMAIPEAALFSKAKPLAALAPTTVPRSIGRDIGERMLDAPGKTLATSVGAGAASGIGSEAAREAGLGAGYQIAAGATAPMAVAAPALAGRTARSLLRIPEDAFTPTAARWKADADGIFRKLGISASADGSIPGETAGGQAAAFTVLANQLRRANVPVEQLETLLDRVATARRFNSNSYAPDAIALVDLDPSLQKLAGSLMRENPGVWRNAVDFMYARQTGLTPARGELPPHTGIPSREPMSPPITGKQAQERYGTTFDTPLKDNVPMGQRERVGNAYKRAMGIKDADYHGHAPNAEMTDAQLEAFAGQAAKPLYDTARAAGKGVDLRPTVGPILDRWEAAIADQPGPVRAQLRKQINEVRQAINVREGVDHPVRGTSSPFERFDNWKKYLDEDIRKYYGSDKTHNRVTGNALQQFKRELLDGADIVDPRTGKTTHIPGLDEIQDNGLGPAYKKARGVFSSVADSRRALEMGTKIWKGEAGLNEYNTLEGDEASQKLVRLGMHGGYEADTKNMPRGHDVTKLFDKPRLQEVLSEIIPRSKGNGEFSDTPERFGRYLSHEQMIQGTPKRTFQGSPTAERLADDKAANELFDLTDQLKKGGWQHVVSNYAADILNKYFGTRADTAATLSRALFTADPIQRAQAIDGIRRVMSQDQFTHFQRLMDGQARRIVQSGAASVGPTASHGVAPVSVNSPEEAQRLPPGTEFITPDGQHKINRPKGQ